MATKRLIETMFGNTKGKMADPNNVGKKTPGATAPMANAYTNATVLEKIKNLVANFHHRKSNETSLRFLCLNRKVGMATDVLDRGPGLVRVWCGAGLGRDIHNPQNSEPCGRGLVRCRV